LGFALSFLALVGLAVLAGVGSRPAFFVGRLAMVFHYPVAREGLIQIGNHAYATVYTYIP
jgi:hypothetical protein